MSVYSQYAIGSTGGESIGVNEDYVGALGAFQMMEETAINTHAIFEHVLGCDFAEAQYGHGLITESTLEAVNEASLKGLFSKVIEFFKKIGEKIKGIIKNFIDKITGMIEKDGKKLVNKFKKQINTKMNSGVYDDNFKYNWCNLQNGEPWDKVDANNGVSGILLLEVPSSVSSKLLKAGKSIVGVLTIAASSKIINTNTTSGTLSDDEKKTMKDDLDAGYKAAKDDETHALNVPGTDDMNDYRDHILSHLLSTVGGNGDTDQSSFAKDFDEAVFDSSEEKEGFTSSEMADVSNFLSNHSKITTKLNKAQRNTEKAIKRITDEAKKIEREMTKLSSTDGRYSLYAAGARAAASTVIKMGNVCTGCTTSYFTAMGAAVKKHYSQCRALWTKAATYNKKKAKNESADILYEYAEEISNYEVDQMMPEF